uniref:Uncharacterized protein n=1 Tax=Arundo donax TaxID=35708 RepID=A0A0A9GHU3_ARUDO
MMPQTASPSASMATKAVLLYCSGTRTAPQHRAVPSPARMHVVLRPSAMAHMLSGSSAAGTAGTPPSPPQQAKPPSSSTAHACWFPAATALKAAGSGISDGAFMPPKQRMAVSSPETTPQRKSSPSAMREKSRPLGSLRVGHSQQAGSWSSERPQTWGPPAESARREGPQ